MNWLDLVIILMILIPMLIGYMRGLIGIVVPLVGIVFGIMFAGRVYGEIADLLHPGLLDSEAQANIVSFIILFVLFFIAIMVVSSILRRFMRLLFLGWVDKIGGLAFGLVFGFIVASAFLAIITSFFTESVKAAVTDSPLASFLLDRFPFVFHLLPSHFREVIQAIF